MFDDLASSVDPYLVYVALRERGVHRLDDGRWVVSRAVDVAAVLAHCAARVECRRSGDDRLDDVRALMARFSNGVDHVRRRATATSALAGLGADNFRSRASKIAADLLVRARSDARVGDLDGDDDGGTRVADGVELVALSRYVVPVVLAEVLGFADPVATASAIGVLATALAPRSDKPGPTKAAVGTALSALLTAAPAALGGEVAVNLIALLHQSLDATAGLVASAVLAAARHDCCGADVAALVREANRWDPPVQHTTRIAADDVALGDIVIAPGERIVVLLAAANRDPNAVDAPDEFRPGRVERGFAFGAGVHACPGESIALELATSIVDAVVSAGLRSISTDVHYERRSNLRIAADLVVAPAV